MFISSYRPRLKNVAWLNSLMSPEPPHIDKLNCSDVRQSKIYHVTIQGVNELKGTVFELM